MQHDLDRIWRRKRFYRRFLIVMIVLLLLALALVAARACSMRYGDVYNKGYTPFDEQRQQLLEEQR